MKPRLPCLVTVLLMSAVVSLAGPTTVRVSLEWLGRARPEPACTASHDLSSGETWHWATRLVASDDGVQVECLDGNPAAALPPGDGVARAAVTLRTPRPPQYPHVVLELGGGDGKSVRTRELYLEFDDQILVPAGRRDGMANDFVRLRAVDAHRPAVSYSPLIVVSRWAGARILLDGGLAGTVGEGGETTLPHVRTGERLVTLEDASGPGGIRVVQVHPGRTALVGLEMDAPEPPGFGLEPLGKNAQGHDEFRRPRDGAVVIRIPAGEFLMGNRNSERQPLEHTVYVSEFLIDKTEVTWGQYKRFLAATAGSMPPIEPYWGIHEDHAVVFVDWEEAKAHCEWAGGRLATEAEWEKAARGTDGRKFPWGNDEPTRDLAVHRRGWGFQATDPATAHADAASPYGALDMGGSLWEWCADWYDREYFDVSPARDPRGPSSGLARVVRGGSWDSRPDVLSASVRGWGPRGYREGDFGFRCAMDPP